MNIFSTFRFIAKISDENVRKLRVVFKENSTELYLGLASL